MFTLEELLSKKNQRIAMAYLATKKEGSGSDGVKLSELEEYWRLNEKRICKELEDGIYRPGVVKCFEITNNVGKRRKVCNLTTIDRFLGRLLAQKLERYLAPDFLPGSYAYQVGKGTLDAVNQAKAYIEQGKRYVAVLDIKDYFDTIPLQALLELVNGQIGDERVQKLIESYLYCSVDYEGQISAKTVGILQGSPISPILSNWYLHGLDCFMEGKAYAWIRFADNIYIYTEEGEQATEVYNELSERLKKVHALNLNMKKSGVFEAVNRGILGYDFAEKAGAIEIQRHHYQRTHLLHYWQPTQIQKCNQEYHMISDGILNKKDYALLFENEEEKHHIPVEVVNQLNFYSDVTISTNVLKTLSEKKIRASFFDRYGNRVGTFVPEQVTGDGKVLLKQCEVYNDTTVRLEIARQMEFANIHNMRAVVRYYNKKIDLDNYVRKLNQYMQEINEGKTVDQLLLIEARARQDYYSVFNEILSGADFRFEKRSKRPPKDALNSMIRFGNTLLYNEFLQYIWKTPLEARIGMVHATNRRAHSLNLDFADIFKPIVVDRVIFTLINCKRIRMEHFEKAEGDGVYLNREGKRIFLTEFQQKLTSEIVIKGKTYTYQHLMEQEVRNYHHFVMEGMKYKPYKYY